MYVEQLCKEEPHCEIPDFDPLDSGIEAEALFLFEKPGPRTVRNSGSGFISRNNDDCTAQTTCELMLKAEIPRKPAVIWNVVPGWNGIRKVTTREVCNGIKHLKQLLRLLTNLKVIVFVGRKAASARAHKSVNREFQKLHLLESVHPSPIVKATQRARWDRIPEEWARIHSSSHQSGMLKSLASTN